MYYQVYLEEAEADEEEVEEDVDVEMCLKMKERQQRLLTRLSLMQVRWRGVALLVRLLVRRTRVVTVWRIEHVALRAMNTIRPPSLR